MSSSYENRWLGDEKKSPLAHRKSLTTEESNSAPSTPSKKGKENPQQPAKKSQKEMTKAERRAIQEKQREEKAKRMNAQQQNKAGNNAKNDKSKAPAAPAAVAVAAKKKAVTKGQQNQAPWLLHLDPPKRPEATKDLHPAVVQLGLYFSEHKIVGSNARCVAMLEIFAKVCWDKRTRWNKESSFSARIRKDGLIDILSLLNKGD
jgi:translation initiation factor eIF-2B subunit delta